MVGAFGQQWRHNASHHREFQIHPPHQKKEKNEIQQHGRKAANHTQIYARLNSKLGQAGHDEVVFSASSTYGGLQSPRFNSTTLSNLIGRWEIKMNILFLFLFFNKNKFDYFNTYI